MHLFKVNKGPFPSSCALAKNGVRIILIRFSGQTETEERRMENKSEPNNEREYVRES